MLRTLWRAKGGYTATIRFDPSLDCAEFGNQYGTGKYTAEFKFEITDDGKWSADFSWDFKQHWEYEPYKEDERQGPFFAQDFSNMTSNASIRARKLARPKWGMNGRSGADYVKLFDEESFLNKTIDWSFVYTWKGTGKWTDNNSIEVPNAITQPIKFYKTVES